LGSLPIACTQQTTTNTSQYAHMDTQITLRKSFISRLSEIFISSQNKSVNKDNFFADIAAHYSDIMCHCGTALFQLYCACKSFLYARYAIKTCDEMVSTSEIFFHQHGIPNSQFSDRMKAQNLWTSSNLCQQSLLMWVSSAASKLGCTAYSRSQENVLPAHGA
jgi:hypothetical protein